MKTFYLSGGLGDSSGLGDSIYALPTIKAFGGGTFVYGGAKRSHLMLKSLFEAQPYITACLHVSEIDLPRDFINLDLFRNSQLLSRDHLVNAFLHYFGFPRYDFSGGGWLENIPDQTFTNRPYGVVNITPRYRDKIFMWMNGWRNECAWPFINVGARHVFFLGSREEYIAVAPKVNAGRPAEMKIRHLETGDLLAAATIIKGAASFSGTQSALMAIRQGLALPYRVEWSPHTVDVCQFNDKETRINPFTRKLHFAYVMGKRLLNKRI